MLPKLKSLDLAYHQIDLQFLLKFCGERRKTLERVQLARIVNSNPRLECSDIADRLQKVLGGTGNAVIDASERCYTGHGWYDLVSYW